MYSRVYVEITNVCNRSCTFCPGTKRPPRRMSLGEFDIITDKLKGVTEYIYLHVMGEPLTHPELADMVKMASGKGFHAAVTTNGTLLTERGDELIGAGVYKVNISVHSFEDGTEDDYRSYLEGCLDFADRASQSGVLTVLRLWNRGHDGGRNVDTVALMRERLPGEWKEGSRGWRIRHGLHLEYGDRFEWPDMSVSEGDDSVFCYGLGDHFGILSDGSVIPCCLDREGVITLGNLLDSGVTAQSVLNAPRAAAIREGFKCRRAVEDLCRRCGYARRF